MNVLTAIRGMLRGAAMTADARGMPDIASLVGDALALVDEELARLAAGAARSRARRGARKRPATDRGQTPVDTRTLSLFSLSDLEIKERGESLLAPAAVEPTAPPLPAELPPELAPIATKHRVRDPSACWSVFRLRKAGKVLLDLAREWEAWCIRERDKLPAERAPPVHTAKARAAPGLARPRAPPRPNEPRPGPIAPELLGPLLSALGSRSSALPLTAQGA